MRGILKFISTLTALALMLTMVSASGLESENLLDLETIEQSEEENSWDVIDTSGDSLISTEIGENYTIQRNSYTTTVSAGGYKTSSAQVELLAGDYIYFDYEFSPTLSGTM
ncbi:MAG: hypothetical protein LUG49_02550 [Oscillospiraceae bacterium]|nr:hypothetical protein [Oscillospiraceae bacterium]